MSFIRRAGFCASVIVLIADWGLNCRADTSDERAAAGTAATSGIEMAQKSQDATAGAAAGEAAAAQQAGEAAAAAGEAAQRAGTSAGSN
jgi:hypothetical protein